ncbi:ABC transporter permease [Petropleomorpha daqingensis]|uniref:ABC transporter permease n=1 Tax=Petropleomorpha daqingensis TaxID=2026353 RepID=UPI0015CCA4F8|nr:ABC transporter permease [Petropleomorpha daqingensis]
MLRGIVVPALAATINGVAFVALYTAAFHDPVPHHLPLAVVGSAQQVEQARAAVDPSQFALRQLPDAAAAAEAVRRREVFGALVVDTPQPELLIAGANTQAVTMTVTQAFQPVEEQLGAPAQQHDLSPLVPGDTRGLTIFYGGFGVVLGGFLFGVASFAAAPQMLLRYRIVSVVLFAVLAGALTSWLIDGVYAAVPAGFFLVFGLVALLATACAATAALLFRVFGSAGQILTAIGLVIIGNATSTGQLPAEFLPPWMQPLPAVLPNGVTVRALRGALYFQDDGVARAWVVLGVWTVVPLLLIALLDALSRRRRTHA